MIPKLKGNDIQLFVIKSIYKKDSKTLKDPQGHRIKDEFGKSIKIEQDKFVKEGYCKVWFDKNDIRPFGEYIGSKGQVVKNRTLIFSRITQSFFTVAHSVSDMEKALINPMTGIGYNKNKTNEI